MKAIHFIALFSIVANLVYGCCFHKDLTMSPQVQASGTLGQSFRTTEQLDLIKDTHSRILFLAERDYSTSSRDQQIGILKAGTELHINQVEQVKELVAVLLFLPEYYQWECTLAKVEDGPFAGTEVAISGKGLLFKTGAVTNGSPMLISNKTPSNATPEPFR